jgi:hypothetical protein
MQIWDARLSVAGAILLSQGKTLLIEVLQLVDVLLQTIYYDGLLWAYDGDKSCIFHALNVLQLRVVNAVSVAQGYAQARVLPVED